MMDLLSNATFWTIATIVVSALGLRRAIRADRRREWQEIEQRREAGEKRLADQIVRLGQEVRQELTSRMDRLEDRVAANTVAIAELKAEMAEVKTELKAEMAEVKTELKAEMAEVKTELTGEMAALKADLKTEVRALSIKIDERSVPRRFQEPDVAAVGRGVAQGAGVRETAGDYSGDEQPQG